MILHFPTILLLIGFPVFWIEMAVLHRGGGRTTMSAAFLAGAAFLILLIRQRAWMKDRVVVLRADWKLLPILSKIIFLFGGMILLVIGATALYASFFPPHLLPELDVLNYHYTLPRQHLILRNFTHLPWSTADLWTLPVQFALAPYWFVTGLPNKIPQFFFMLGLWAISSRLAYRFAGGERPLQAALLVLIAVAGSHGFSIQYGSAMLDIPNTYLFIAAIDSFLDRSYFLSAAELAFYAWAKSFLPVQLAAVVLITAAALWSAKKAGWTISWVAGGAPVQWTGWRRVLGFFLLLSLFTGLPFCLKSLYYAGTPLYPAQAGRLPIFSSATQDRRPELIRRANQLISGVNAGYGEGRGVRAWARHFWTLAVPTQGVNNPFDYPAGLSYLLFVGPFLFFLMRAFSRKQAPVLALWAVLIWAFWWMSSQQTRFLYVAFILIFLSVASTQVIVASRVFAAGLVLAAAVTMLSVVRSHQPDFGKSRWDVLREEDKQLIRAGQSFTDQSNFVQWPQKEVAYATFPVVIKKGDVFILEQP